KAGPLVFSGVLVPSPIVVNQSWGSFDDSATPPTVYPAAARGKFQVRLRAFNDLYDSAPLGGVPMTVFNLVTNRLFRVDVPPGGLAVLQTSTNETDWISLCTVTNTGGITEW